MCSGLQALQSLPLCFFTTEAVPLKLSTHKTMDLQFGTDTHKEEFEIWYKTHTGGGGAATTESLRVNTSTAKALCAFNHTMLATAIGRTGGWSGDRTVKNFPLHFVDYHYCHRSWVLPTSHCTDLKFGRLFCLTLGCTKSNFGTLQKSTFILAKTLKFPISCRVYCLFESRAVGSIWGHNLKIRDRDAHYEITINELTYLLYMELLIVYL